MSDNNYQKNNPQQPSKDHMNPKGTTGGFGGQPNLKQPNANTGKPSAGTGWKKDDIKDKERGK